MRIAPLELVRNAWDGWRGSSAGQQDDEARIRAARLNAVERLTPLTMIANLINGSIVVAIVRQEANAVVLAIWALFVLAIVGLTMWAWLLRRQSGPRQQASVRTMQRATYHATILATLWAMVPILWFGVIPPGDQLIVACLVTGMICAGGFALATVPFAAVAYVVILAIGSAIGLAQTGSGFVMSKIALLTAYTGIVLQSVAGTSRLFDERFRAEASLKERGEIIELLLNEFEQHASDWLFETDPDFTIIRHSSRFAEVAGIRGGTLAGRRLGDMANDEGRGALQALADRREPFRDLDICIDIYGQPRWWTLTAKPLSDENGLHTGWRGVGSDVTDRRQAADKVVWMARTDALTGLPNRTHFRELAALRLETARRNGGRFALACIDLDHFKTVNDTLGHPVGDALLTRVAHELADLAGPGVVFGRLGGDEFGMVATDFIRPAEILELAKHIIEKVSASKTIVGARITVGASIGVAFASAATRTIDEVIRNADLALYRAKDDGRGTVAVFDDAMHREAEDRRQLQEDLRVALANDQLRINYQPIVAIGSGALLGFEALVRWHHPQRGILAPGVFIPLAEESGLIDQIGAWVLRRACLDAATWPQHMRVAVNISPAQFGSASLLNHVAQALAASHLRPDRLEIEITEALFMKHRAESDRFLLDMRSLGVHIALDDFGTGFSSLSYLTRFPIQKLKIDRSFVSGGADVESRKAVVEAIVGIARSLGFVTTAEGVETGGDLAWVKELGCDQAQGYYFARPLPVEKVAGFIATFEAGATASTPPARVA